MVRQRGQIDPKERLVAIALAKHFPFSEHGFSSLDFRVGLG